ncbi:MAG: cobalamin biosynthesis protein CobD [Proteobacteria bacterium]|nr:cobalamin biosynthesis protein CobD [Pseudomonadota bacterium]
MPSHTVFAAGPAPLILLLLALLLDAYIGDPPGLWRVAPHPVALMGRAVAGLERRLNRESRGEADRRVRGVLVVLFLTAAGAAVGWAISRTARAVPFGWLAELALVMTLVAQRSLYRHVGAVARALEEGGLAEGRRAVAHIVGRNPANLDRYGVARGAIESCAENLADGVIGPVFWYVLLGLPGLVASKMVNTLDSMIGHRSPRYRAFGAAAARLDDAVNFVPARLSGAIVALAAALVPRANPVAAARTMLRDAGKHRSLNAGWPEAAMAGALGLALAGPRRYGDAVVKDAWLGDGRARATPGDIRRALYLFVVACLINIGLVAALAVAKHGLS